MTATAETETYSAVGCDAAHLKKEVIPILDMLEICLQRKVTLRMKEDNTQVISAVKKGYSPNLRHLQRHNRLSLAFVNEIFCSKDDPHPNPEASEAPEPYEAHVEYVETKLQKGNWMTKDLQRAEFIAAKIMAGMKPTKPVVKPTETVVTSKT